MEAQELLKKLRALEEGQAELEREIGRLVPEAERRGGARPTARRRRRPPPAFPSSSSRRAIAAFPHPSFSSRLLHRARLSDRHCHWILQSLGQAVHIIAPDGKLLYWNRYAEHMYGYSASEAISRDAVELIVHPTDFDAANIVIQNIFMGKCFRGKFPVKNKSGERFFIVVNNTPLYDDDGSLIGLICLSLDVRTLQEATKVTSRAHSRVRTGHNCNVQYGSSCEDQDSEHEVRAELTSSEASTPNGDVRHGVFVAEEKSPGKSSKTNDDSGDGKVGFHKMFSSKAEGLLAKKGIPWPWKGRENDGGSGKNNVTSTPLHDKQENDRSHQRVPEPITIPERQDSDYVQTSKYEVSGSWWTFNNNSTSNMSSTSSNGSPIERLDYEADCLDYEILWEDLVVGEQIGQGSCGTVYHALWYGSDVAVKLFSGQEYSEEMINTFRQEVSLMKKLRHPNMILFMGAVASQRRLCIVTEFLPRSDVYSYGVVLWELVAQKIPWDTLNTMQVIGAVGFMDQRLEIPSNTDPEWASIIESCWDSDPQRRPSFRELLERLQELQKQYATQAQTQRKAAGKGAGKMSGDASFVS
ncbi:hypothetical protein ACQ4PT_033565 [Festuca glaucescens]